MPDSLTTSATPSVLPKPQDRDVRYVQVGNADDTSYTVLPHAPTPRH